MKHYKVTLKCRKKKEREQQEETQREMQSILQDSERKNTELWVFYNKAKDKNTETEEEKEHLEKIWTDIQFRFWEMVTCIKRSDDGNT